MAKSAGSKPSRGVLNILQDIEKLKHLEVPGSGLDPKLKLLRLWQSERLAQTYSDLIATVRYRPACDFFLNELYGARDFSQRDHDIEQMYDFMQRVFPAEMIRPLRLTVELHRQTQALDSQLLEVLVNQLGLTDSLTPELYAEGYRRCDNYVERVKQIDAIYKIGMLLDGIMDQPLTGAALTLAKVPARRAGWNELTNFLEAGYNAFRRMKGGAAYFLDTVREREQKILDRIYAEQPDPFSI